MALYLKGALFACKYIVYYGITSLINRLFNMKTTQLPRCISIIHTNSEMWRYFDTGIYEFIKKLLSFFSNNNFQINNSDYSVNSYLYIPFGGSKNTIFKQILSLTLSFLFISGWHGMTWRVALWSLANWFMVLLEIFFLNFCSSFSWMTHLVYSISLKEKFLILF